MTAIGTPNLQAVQQLLLAVLDYVIARDAAIERERAQKAAELIQPTPGSAVSSLDEYHSDFVPLEVFPSSSSASAPAS